MERLVPISGDPFFPTRRTIAGRLPQLVMSAPRTTFEWLSRTTHRYARPIRMFVYSASGIIVGTLALLLGVGPADAASFGTNTTTVLLSVWPVPVRRERAEEPTQPKVSPIPLKKLELSTSEQRRLARSARRFQERQRLARAAEPGTDRTEA
ncbi:hypothetical protein ACIOHS_45195 [Streptomyces sp. NPDC088253]|uniref:hypothetical protein n=1 Tax=Streptomyces sp. NPDC088253 TaxID=3365846 RepID=UPI0038147A34